MAKRSGRPSAAQTPAPKSDKIVGSSSNKPNSATSKGASSIKLSAKTVSFLKKKLEEFNKKYPNKDNVSLNDLKAVYRRGSGAFSTSHRPNMNRAGWAYARTNKFLEKAAGKKVKAAYVQDDDLLKYEDGGKVGEEITCSNCGWEWNTSDSKGKDKYTCHKCGKINKMKKYNPKDLKKEVKERQPRDLRKLKNFYSAHKGAEWLVLREINDDYDKEDVKKADRWYDLMHKNQKIKKLTKKEFEEFKELTIFCASNEQSLEYAEGGEINYMEKYNPKDFKKGVKEELSEHKKTFQDLKKDKISVDEAAKSVVAEHLKKKPDYYEKYKGGNYLAKGGLTDDEGKLIDLKVGNSVIKYKRLNSNQPKQQIGGVGIISKITGSMANVVFEPNNYEVWIALKDLKKSNTKMTDGGNYLAKGGKIDKVERWGFFYGDKLDSFYINKYTAEKYRDKDVWYRDDPSRSTINIKQIFLKKEDLKRIGEINADLKEKIKGGYMYRSRNSEKITKLENEKKELIKKIEEYNKASKMADGGYLKKGGQLNPDDKSTKDFYAHKSGNAGGMLVGKRHSEGGIKAVNKSTGQPLEMEGGETVITRDAVSDNTKREFEGEMLTNRQILSKINVSGGGVSFAEGGDVPYKCACSGKKYKYGGDLLPDYHIVDILGGQHEYFDSLLPSEAFNLMFDFTPKFEEGGTIYEDGGMIRLVSKKVPSLQEYISKNFGISKGLEKKTYKNYLFSTYSIVFDKLPTMVKNGLLMGNQKLVDKYING